MSIASCNLYANKYPTQKEQQEASANQDHQDLDQTTAQIIFCCSTFIYDIHWYVLLASDLQAPDEQIRWSTVVT
jgi:hypothetical protein